MSVSALWLLGQPRSTAVSEDKVWVTCHLGHLCCPQWHRVELAVHDMTCSPQRFMQYRLLERRQDTHEKNRTVDPLLNTTLKETGTKFHFHFCLNAWIPRVSINLFSNIYIYLRDENLIILDSIQWNNCEFFGFKVMKLLGTIPLIQFHTVSWGIRRTRLHFAPSSHER